jgi:hypothetical protein
MINRVYSVIIWESHILLQIQYFIIELNMVKLIIICPRKSIKKMVGDLVDYFKRSNI